MFETSMEVGRFGENKPLTVDVPVRAIYDAVSETSFDVERALGVLRADSLCDIQIDEIPFALGLVESRRMTEIRASVQESMKREDSGGRVHKGWMQYDGEARRSLANEEGELSDLEEIGLVLMRAIMWRNARRSEAFVDGFKHALNKLKKSIGLLEKELDEIPDMELYDSQRDSLQARIRFNGKKLDELKLVFQELNESLNV